MFTLMQTLRTPDGRFTDLPEFPYTPNYSDVSDDDGGTLRMAWVQAGPANADPVLMLHGEPSWSYLYRGRASCHLPGLGRLRSFRQADAHRGSQLRAPCRVGAGLGVRHLGPEPGHPGRPGLGRADRIAFGR